VKLNEIVKIPTQPGETFILPSSLLTHSTPLGKSEGREVLSGSFTDQGQELFVFFNADDAGFQAYVVVHEVRLGERDIGVVVRTWARESLRRKGYVSGLIKFILDHIHLSIMSDDKHTPAAQLLWVGLAEKFNVQAINVKTGKIQGSTKKVYSSSTTPTNLRLFIESGAVRIGEGWAPHYTKRLTVRADSTLPPYNHFCDGDL
jgi:hypothetical protein